MSAAVDERARQALQVTQDISVGGTQAIGGQNESPNLALIDEIVNENRVDSPSLAIAEQPTLVGNLNNPRSSADGLRRSISNPFLQTSR